MTELKAAGYTLLRSRRSRKTTSPAQLVHDFERLPHVARIECDGTLPLHAVVLVHGVRTVPGAPERDETLEGRLQCNASVEQRRTECLSVKCDFQNIISRRAA